MTPPDQGAGGTGAFVETALTHLDAVHRLARHLAPPGSSAEDLVQETYARALEAATRQEVRDVRSWLLTICLNVVRNEARTRSRRPEQLVEPAAMLDFGPAGSGGGDATRLQHEPGPAQLAEMGERRRAVGRALGQLPSSQRDAVVLVDVVGCTAREAAELLGCPRGSVLAWVHRGRRRLATLLESEGVERDL